jgi:hypothetical protein
MYIDTAVATTVLDLHYSQVTVPEFKPRLTGGLQSRCYNQSLTTSNQELRYRGGRWC